MDIFELEQQAELNKTKTISIFNPLDEDLVVNYDSKPLEPAKKLDFTTYPYYEGQHVKKYLIRAIMIKRKVSDTDEKSIKEIEKEVSNVV